MARRPLTTLRRYYGHVTTPEQGKSQARQRQTDKTDRQDRQTRQRERWTASLGVTIEWNALSRGSRSQVAPAAGGTDWMIYIATVIIACAIYRQAFGFKALGGTH
ncbi:hypothetical protein TEQG_01427 [Trichophyton equinum CBS 127.97]|uniref:Uncharacterized protein n=1 Tax=Trichophyton equinum (strain ATCC MYA-4606 / CBS 127.97) TaxID=559882 RepID=F2PKH2_TRIEC|nr:hypothetical protein TEQG_01427 [Trichophyton equinum CBS 127.97]